LSQGPDLQEASPPAGAPVPARKKASLAELLAELKRRRVFRVMAGYGIFAFAVLQVIEPIMHGAHLGDWVLTAVLVALAVGFPVAVILSWVFDFTAEGVVRTSSAAGGPKLSRGRMASLLLGIGLVAALPGLGWYAWKRGRDMPPGAATETGPSVAVLPFVNMSGDPENEYFSDGLSEEILNTLAQIPGLRVPARTSAFAFKGKPQDVGRIAEALHVANILEGSVRKGDGRVRITAQLVKASDGYHLWSQTFERDLKNVFAVQDEIAAAIAGALKLQLATGVGGSLRKAGLTSSPEAYEAYLKGRQTFSDRTRPSIEKSLAHFQRAVVLDPAFAVAYADAAIATLLLARGSYGSDLELSQAVARARPLLERAQAVAPDHPEVLAAAGVLEKCDFHFERALELFDRSLALNPTNAEVHVWRKGVLEELDRYDQLLPALAAAVQVDPLSRLALGGYQEALFTWGRDAEGLAVIERLRAIDEAWGLEALGYRAAAVGDRATAIRNLVPAFQQQRGVGYRLSYALAELGLVAEARRVAVDDPVTVAWATGNFAQGLDLTEPAFRERPQDDLAQANHFFSLYGARRFEEAAQLAALIFREGKGRWMGPYNLLPMADAARRAGRVQEAIRYRNLAARRLDLWLRAGVLPSSMELDRAGLMAYDGRDDEVTAALVAYLDSPLCPLGRAELAIPLFDRIARRPDLQAALRRLDGRLATQRTEVVALLCGPQPASATWHPAAETCALAGPTGALPSIAVLAFDDLSEKHDQGYFADGVAEEILNALAHVEGLRVPGRTSSFWFKGKNVEPAEIGRKLAVTHLLEGSVRRAGKRVRVTAQIVNIADGGHLWSETFDRSEADIFAVQDEVAKAVAQALRVRLLPGSGSAAEGTRTSNPEVYRLYLLGRQQLRTFNQESNARAIASFKQALALEPTYAPAWAGLAHATFLSSATFEADSNVTRPAVLAAAEKAIALAPGVADGFAVRAELRRALFDFSGAHADIDRALSLSPNDANTLVVQARLLANEGRLAESLKAARRAVDLDPLNAEAWVRLSSVLVGLNDLAGVRTAVAKAEAINGKNNPADYYAVLAELLAKEPAAALEVARRSDLAWVRLTGVAMAQHSLGRAAESQAALDELISGHQREAAYQVAEVYAWRGEQDRALAWLDRAYDQRDTGLGHLTYDPALRLLRGDPRFRALLKKLKLPLD
jgi:TolB-like protein/predicted Zn-dependent protease